MLFSFIRPDKKCKRFRALRIHPCKCIMILSRFGAVRIVGIANAHFREKSFSLSHKIALFSHHTVYCFYLYCNLNYKKCFCIILSIFMHFYIASSSILPIFAEKNFYESNAISFTQCHQFLPFQRTFI